MDCTREPSPILVISDNVIFFPGVTLQGAAVSSTATVSRVLPVVINRKLSLVLTCPVGTMYVW